MTPNELAAAIQIAVDRGYADVPARARAWEDIVALWKAGDTKEIVKALANSQINEHLFLAELLCRIWSAFLGEGPRALGQYIAETELNPGERTAQFTWANFDLLKSLVQIGCLHPPLEGPNKHLWTARAWEHIHRAPKVARWDDLLLSLDTSGDVSRTIASVVREAKNHNMDLDYVIARSFNDLPSGIVGFGQSAEARGYLFCHVSSVYAYGTDIFTFQHSPRTQWLLNRLNVMTPKMLDVFLEQTCPILESFPHPLPPTSSAEGVGMAAVSTGTTKLPSFWLCAIDLAATNESPRIKAIWELLGPVLPNACNYYEHLTASFPPVRPAPIPIMTVVGLIIAGNCSVEFTPNNAVDNQLQPEEGPLPIARPAHAKKPNRPLGLTHFGWMLSVRFPDVDALLRCWPNSFLYKAWSDILRPLTTSLFRVICGMDHAAYRAAANAVAGAMVDIYRFDILTGSDKATLGVFWLRLIALCSDYTKAFEDAIIERADRRTAEAIFTGVMDMLRPYPVVELARQVGPLQNIYTDAAYLDSKTRPAHIVDHFIEVSVELAREKTAIAQALLDSGIMLLLTAIRDDDYEYPDVPDTETPEVRSIEQQAMCTKAISVLSERL